MIATLNLRASVNAIGKLSCIVAFAIAAPAAAQTALDSASVSVAPERITPSTDLTVVKDENAKGFVVRVVNSGPDAVTGAVVADKVGSGRSCPAGNPVTITGNGVPVGSYTISSLTGPGIVLGTLSSGQAATLTYSCQEN